MKGASLLLGTRGAATLLTFITAPEHFTDSTQPLGQAEPNILTIQGASTKEIDVINKHRCLA